MSTRYYIIVPRSTARLPFDTYEAARREAQDLRADGFDPRIITQRCRD